MVRGIPSFMKEADVKQLVAEMGSALQDFIGKRDYEEERRVRLAFLPQAMPKSSSFLRRRRLLYKQLQKTDRSSSLPQRGSQLGLI